MIDVPAGSGPRGRVVVGVNSTPNSLAALRRAACQAPNRDTSLNIDYVIQAGANEAAEASSHEMLGIARARWLLRGPADLIVARGGRGHAARPVARVLRETGSDVR